MKLDVNVLRYLSRDDFRVLTAVEMGQKNHEIVPMPLIDSISGLKHGGAFRCIRTLLKHKLVHHEGKTYDGYRLTYMGYDFLAIRAMTQRGHIAGVGRQIGVGKESDIYEVMDDEGEVYALKLHRLGRTSFRAVKNQRDYLGRRTNYSWLYLSRLAALKEFAFMKALGDNGFPVPRAIDSNRHAVLMTMVDGRQMVQVAKHIPNPPKVYLTCMELISRLAGKGLIHCDFNEFNLMISDEGEVTLIDFPQMVSVNHANAKELYDRDVECIVRFFSKKAGYLPENDRSLPYVRPNFKDAVSAVDESLDVALAASGFQREHQQALEEWAAQEAERGDEDPEGDEWEEDDEGEEGEEEDSDGAEGERVVDGEEAGPRGEVGEGEGNGDAGKEKAEGKEGEKEDEDGEEEGVSGSDWDGEGSDEEEGEGVEKGEGEGQDGVEGRRRGPGKGRTGTSKMVTPLGAREVQAVVAAQQRKALKSEMITRATRNSSKAPKGKGTKGKKGGGGSATNGGDFGGW